MTRSSVSARRGLRRSSILPALAQWLGGFMVVPKKFNIDGAEVDGFEVDFEALKEPWSEVRLADGGGFRMRLTVQRVYQLKDASGQPMRDAEGRRRLVIQSKNELVVQD